LANITTYDVYSGVLPPASVVSSSYSSLVPNTNSITFNLADYVILLRFDPVASTPTSAPPTIATSAPISGSPVSVPTAPTFAPPSGIPNVPSAPSSSSPIGPTVEPPSSAPASNGLSGGAIAGIVVGVIAALILLVVIVLIIYKFAIAKNGMERV
jgi:hypothetical protein